MKNAALPPGKTAFHFLPYRNPHLRNSGKLVSGVSRAEVSLEY